MPSNGFSENADPTLSGRNDPCGTTPSGLLAVARLAGYNSHAAIVVLGPRGGQRHRRRRLCPTSTTTCMDFPLSAVCRVTRQPPRSHANPATETGIKFVNLRGYPDSNFDSRIFHVRVEMTEVPAIQLTAVRVASGTNVNLASPGATLDGITMGIGYRVLLNAQTNAAENGVYIWNGPTSPMTRSTDADSGAELTQASVSVTEGAYAGPDLRQTLTVVTVNTDPQSWQPFAKRFKPWSGSRATLPSPTRSLP